MVKERPILFSGEMVRAILSGRKTQTRRVIKPQPEWGGSIPGIQATNSWFWRAQKQRGVELSHWPNIDEFSRELAKHCNYGNIGDRLWVREAFTDAGYITPIYRADCDGLIAENIRWKPSIHMPRRLSRILLEVKEICAEQLQDISVSDADAEGVSISLIQSLPSHSHSVGDSIALFQALWEHINGVGVWRKNPWVWVIKFKKVEQ